MIVFSAHLDRIRGRPSMNEAEGEEGIKQVQSWVEHTPGNPPEALNEQLGERVRVLIDAAEQAAESIRADAERQADEYLAEAQRRADRLTTDRIQLVANLTDELINHAGAARSHSEQMVASLERTIKAIVEDEQIELDPGRAEALPSGSGKRDEAVDPDADQTQTSGVTAYGGTREGVDEEAAGPPAEGDHPDVDNPGSDDPEPSTAESQLELDDEAATLRATRLAIAGNDRDEIAGTLRSEFGVSDPEPILVRVLGPASG